MQCKTTRFDTESLQYRSGWGSYKKVSRTGNRVDQTGIFGLGLVRPKNLICVLYMIIFI
jgi:hypothetical protein